jgi:hypothetical protein
MNWGILMYGAVIIMSTTYYVLIGRHHYTPPKESIKEAIQALDRFYAAEKENGITAEQRNESVTVVGDDNDGQFK